MVQLDSKMDHRPGPQGFTLVEIMMVLLIIGLVAVIGFPNFRRASNESRDKICINNLRQIDSAKAQWAIENRQDDTVIPVETDVEPFIKGGTAKVYCPIDPTKTFANSYSINALGTNPTCLAAPADHTLQES